MYSARQLELVRALAEHRHFGRAAAALGISQPALTRNLKFIEEQLGVLLFDRVGVTPTVFGRIVLQYSQPVLASFAELAREISLTKGLEIGELVVVMGPYAADISGQEAAAIVSEKHPNLSLELCVVNWLHASEAILNGKADLALAEIRDAVELSELDVTPVRSARVSFFCRAGHPLAKRETLSILDLLDYPWAGPVIPTHLSGNLPRETRPFGSFDKATGRFRPRILVETFPIAKSIVMASDALSAAVPLQLTSDVAAGTIVLLPVEVPFIDLQYGFITKRGRMLSPAATAFMEAVMMVERRKS